MALFVSRTLFLIAVLSRREAVVTARRVRQPTSGPCDAVDAVVEDVHAQSVRPSSDRHVLVATSRPVASEVHDVVATFAVSVFVERHAQTVAVFKIHDETTTAVLNDIVCVHFKTLLLARLMGQYSSARWPLSSSVGVGNTPRLACRRLQPCRPGDDVMPPPV